MADGTLAAKPAAEAEASKLLALIQRAEGGDKSALPALRETRARPGFADALGGDIAQRTADRFLDAYCGKHLAVRETTATKMAQLRTELAGANPAAVERLLADRAVLCWFHVYELELTYVSKKSMTLALAQHYPKCIDRAHPRYLSAPERRWPRSAS